MRLGDKQTNMLLFAAEGVGAVFVAVFLGAYLGGLPSTEVLHSEPVFRWLLSVFGALFLILIFAAVAISVLIKTKNKL